MYSFYAIQGTLSPLGHAVMANCVHIVKYLLENKDLDKSLYGVCIYSAK